MSSMQELWDSLSLGGTKQPISPKSLGVNDLDFGAISGDNMFGITDSLQGFGGMDLSGGVGSPNGLFSGILDSDFLSGLGDLAGAGSALFGAYNSYNQMGMMKDAVESQQDYARVNLANSAKLTNASLEDRQRARISSTGDPNQTSYESLGTYMDKNRVSGSI